MVKTLQPLAQVGGGGDTAPHLCLLVLTYLVPVIDEQRKCALPDSYYQALVGGIC